jgi:coatomer subunit epsilon
LFDFGGVYLSGFACWFVTAYFEQMEVSSELDPFIPARQLFYLGNYRGVIAEVEHIEITDSKMNLLKDVLLMRSLIGMHRSNDVLDRLDKLNSRAVEYQALRVLALHYRGDKDKAMKGLRDLLARPIEPSKDPMLGHSLVLLVAGIVLFREGNYDEALRTLHSGDSTECHALNVQLYLSMNRPDWARKELAIMKQIDEDSLLTYLAEVWILLASDSDKIQDVFYILQELTERYDITSRILNARALCYMQLDKFTEAEDYLREAMTHEDNQEETLANLIVCLSHMTESDISSIEELIE